MRSCKPCATKGSCGRRSEEARPWSSTEARSSTAGSPTTGRSSGRTWCWTYAPLDGTVDDVAARARTARPPEDGRLTLGGAWGADALVRFYRGPRLVLHVQPPAQRWLHPLGIAPDERGRVTLLGPAAPIMCSAAADPACLKAIRALPGPLAAGTSGGEMTDVGGGLSEAP